jgi:hypothetical protein
MKKVLMLVVLLLISPVWAQTTTLDGTWQGTLLVAPGSELTIQFIVETSDAGYQVKLNTLGSGAIKNVLADSATFDNDALKIQVRELSGSYEGRLIDGEMIGDWRQPGQTLSLNLKRLVFVPLSKEQQARLAGRWEGHLKLPGQDALMLEMNFAVDGEGKISGNLGIPDQTPNKFPMADILVSATEISLSIPMVNGSFNGTFDKAGITGEWQQGTSLPLVMEKRALDPKSRALQLTKEARALLMGEWFGHMETPVVAIPVVYRFEQVEDYVRGYFDSPDQGGVDIPIKSVELNGEDIVIKMASGMEFKGNVESGKLQGIFNQGFQKLPLSMQKGHLPPVALDIKESDGLMGSWQGEIELPTGASSIVFHFEKDPTGIVIGSMDQPNLAMRGARMKSASLSEGTLAIGMSELIRTSYSGSLGGNSVTGTITMGAKTFELNLGRMKKGK